MTSVSQDDILDAMPDQSDESRPRPKFHTTTVRVPTDVWEAAREKAELRGDSLSAIVRDALRRYVRRAN